MSTVPARLSQTATSLQGSARAIADEMRVLAAAVADLESAWAGQARESFRARYAAFRSDAAATVEHLEYAAAALHDIADEYADADRKAAGAQPTPG